MRSICSVRSGYAVFCAAVWAGAAAVAFRFPQWSGVWGRVPFLAAVSVWLFAGALPLVRNPDPGKASVLALAAPVLRLVSAGLFALVALRFCKVSAVPWLAVYSSFYLVIFLGGSFAGLKGNRPRARRSHGKRIERPERAE